MTARVERLARLAVAGLVILISGYTVASGLQEAITGRFLGDVDAYWDAAVRLRQGEPLYADLGLTTAEVYRYAPWFAFAWLPLTLLPRPFVEGAWFVVLVSASVAAVLPFAMTRTLPGTLLAVLLGSGLAFACHKGNVQPLVVAGLVHGVSNRAGPVAIALAASVKATPLILAAVYAGRREWTKFAWTLALSTILIAPMLLYDLSGYAFEPGPVPGPLRALGPLPWLVGSAALAGVVIAFPLWLTGAAALVLALPRLLPYDLSYLLVAAPDIRNSRASVRTDRR